LNSELIPWELQHPEPTTGTASGTAFYSDGVTPLPIGTVQTIRIDSGSVATDGKPLESGKFSVEENGGDYTLNIIFEGTVAGSVNVTIINGQDVPQDVVTNWGLVL